MSEESDSFWRRLKTRFRAKANDPGLREAIEEVIEELEGEDATEETRPMDDHERLMLANVLKLRHLTAYDVMVPRADIIAVEQTASYGELLEILTRERHSRLPIYRETLDDMVGFVHMKDVLPFAADPKTFTMKEVRRDVLIIAPSMRAMDLLLEMRQSRRHMALVVDEYGGIDGLITIEDLVEEIVGEIEDEHDLESEPALVMRPDGSVLADGRMDIEDFETQFGPLLTEEERDEDIDTLGGLVVTLAGRVPARGELVTHEASGLTLEVVDADPRRVHRLRLRNIKPRPAEGSDD